MCSVCNGFRFHWRLFFNVPLAFTLVTDALQFCMCFESLACAALDA
ncbi:hypothetical protein XF_2681 [Xylella fastidiosa 9a5c]|uniref:Uncharacterized protein n=1 Tax=Xylella fastidiosa (strain 9a5c) TaxID=160492 RepID=Q9PA39_XYLFA|nr:hypothetical protein XF_2681 [Xylella fastidiosa 9a5c]